MAGGWMIFSKIKFIIISEDYLNDVIGMSKINLAIEMAS